MEETELRLWEKVRILRERLDMLRRQVADAEKQEKLLARREEWYVGTYRRAKHACMQTDVPPWKRNARDGRDGRGHCGRPAPLSQKIFL